MTQPQLHSLVAALEIPECGCEVVWGQLHTRECERLRGKERCTCPPVILSPPCEHVLAADHDTDPDDWSALQRIDDAGEYARPPDPPPARGLSRQNRVAVYEERAALGLGLWNDDDDWRGRAPDDELKVASVSQREGQTARLRNGRVNPNESLATNERDSA